jgi:translation initiation factor 1
MSKRPPGSRLVYTTDPDPEPEPAPQASAAAYPSAAKQTARVALDRKGRGGKSVTVVSGLRHDPATLEALLKRLKQQCGAGGALKDGTIEIQGDQRERVATALAAMGYGVKRAGG